MSENQDCRMTRGDDRLRQPSWDLPAELKSIEARLAALSPREAGLDREQLMFLAGRASVESQVEMSPNVGRHRLEHKAWSAAFAAMTAIAATLLGMLLTNPEVNNHPIRRFASVRNDAPTAKSLSHSPMRSNSGVLFTSDVYRGDIEKILSAVNRADSEEPETIPIDNAHRSTLTPASWRQIDVPDSIGPRANDSSNAPMNPGVIS